MGLVGVLHKGERERKDKEGIWDGHVELGEYW